jgi:predicted nucleic acid-binding protein
VAGLLLAIKRMSAKRFLDTNILVYAYDIDAGAKRDVALELVRDGWKHLGECAISVQVLQELHVNLRKKGVSLAGASQTVRDFTSWPVINNTVEVFLAGLGEQKRWQVSLWDGLILAAARVAGASELMSEDFGHGQDYGGIRAVNPFVRAREEK